MYIKHNYVYLITMRNAYNVAFSDIPQKQLSNLTEEGMWVHCNKEGNSVDSRRYDCLKETQRGHCLDLLKDFKRERRVTLLYKVYRFFKHTHTKTMQTKSVHRD